MRVGADLRTGQIETTAEVPAAVRARALTRVQSLLRRLAEAPQELRVEALTDGRAEGPCDLLKNLRSEPGLLVPGGGEEVTSFRLTRCRPAWAPSGGRTRRDSSAAWTSPSTGSIGRCSRRSARTRGEVPEVCISANGGWGE
ncbi:hypothetical protein ETD83_32300 [Actinomadura soli]|uniref:Uncharacterized protein n=1 Tax=Actinomadura soli TaxID=2508997 RepID=A0A5C4J5V3_9ACTN|nr:hypothetical protein [Actinomadura soli]TMQ91141.1 hypothetical protein ETD83_32300 [Actinomadura soli]